MDNDQLPEIDESQSLTRNKQRMSSLVKRFGRLFLQHGLLLQLIVGCMLLFGFDKAQTASNQEWFDARAQRSASLEFADDNDNEYQQVHRLVKQLSAILYAMFSIHQWMLLGDIVSWLFEHFIWNRRTILAQQSCKKCNCNVFRRFCPRRKNSNDLPSNVAFQTVGDPIIQSDLFDVRLDPLSTITDKNDTRNGDEQEEEDDDDDVDDDDLNSQDSDSIDIGDDANTAIEMSSHHQEINGLSGNPFVKRNDDEDQENRRETNRLHDDNSGGGDGNMYVERKQTSLMTAEAVAVPLPWRQEHSRWKTCFRLKQNLDQHKQRLCHYLRQVNWWFRFEMVGILVLCSCYQVIVAFSAVKYPVMIGLVFLDFENMIKACVLFASYDQQGHHRLLIHNHCSRWFEARRGPLLYVRSQKEEEEEQEQKKQRKNHGHDRNNDMSTSQWQKYLYHADLKTFKLVHWTHSLIPILIWGIAAEPPFPQHTSKSHTIITPTTPFTMASIVAALGSIFLFWYLRTFMNRSMKVATTTTTTTRIEDRSHPFKKEIACQMLLARLAVWIVWTIAIVATYLIMTYVMDNRLLSWPIKMRPWKSKHQDSDEMEIVEIVRPSALWLVELVLRHWFRNHMLFCGPMLAWIPALGLVTLPTTNSTSSTTTTVLKRTTNRILPTVVRGGGNHHGLFCTHWEQEVLPRWLLLSFLLARMVLQCQTNWNPQLNDSDASDQNSARILLPCMMLIMYCCCLSNSTTTALINLNAIGVLPVLFGLVVVVYVGSVRYCQKIRFCWCCGRHRRRHKQKKL
jgi:hypothetical protein